MGLRGMQIGKTPRTWLESQRTGKQLDTFAEYFETIGTHLKNAQKTLHRADKRFDKASNTLDSLVGASGPAPAIEEAKAPWRYRKARGKISA